MGNGSEEPSLYLIPSRCTHRLEFIYPASNKLPTRRPGAPPDPLNPLVLVLISAALLVAGIIVIGGKA
jgi:hypothetical protein